MLRHTICLASLVAPLLAGPTYAPPRFTDPDRVARLEGILPQVDALYRSYATNQHLPGMIYGVVLDGRLVGVGTHGFANLETHQPVTRETRFRIASMTKSFTALAILKLRDAGRLHLDDPVAKHFRAFRRVQPLTKDAPPVTLRHLLRMAGGFPQDDPWGDRRLADSVAELEALVTGGLSHANAPGVSWEYSNLGYALLGQVVTRASGRPYQEYITTEILKPLGMKDTVWEYAQVPARELALGYRWEHERWSPEPLLHDGTFGAMGGLITTVDDFARYVAFHLDAWPPRDDPESGPVRRATVREMHRPAEVTSVYLDPLVPEGGKPVARVGGYGFGLGWNLDTRGVVRVRHTGGLPGFGSEYRFLPDHGLAVISFANLTYAPMAGINAPVVDLLLDGARLPARELPPSPWLRTRAEQLAVILQTWPAKEMAEALAPNVFLDRALPDWQAELAAKLAKTGPIQTVGPLRPMNQLRGRFRLEGRAGSLEVFFTLTPEATPRIQELKVGEPELR
jgi:CubicO group peptidase (beta-lactamase class C family)